MIKKLLAEYIVCGIAPGLLKDESIKFYNKSLRVKIDILCTVNGIKQIKTKEFDERVNTYARGASARQYESYSTQLPLLERATIKDFLSLIENRPVTADIFLWRTKPTIRKTDEGFDCYFRGAFICK